MSTSEFIDFTVSRYDQEVIVKVKPNIIASEDNLGNKINKRVVGIILGAYNDKVNHLKLGPVKAFYYSFKDISLTLNKLDFKYVSFQHHTT